MQYIFLLVQIDGWLGSMVYRNHCFFFNSGLKFLWVTEDGPSLYISDVPHQPRGPAGPSSGTTWKALCEYLDRAVCFLWMDTLRYELQTNCLPIFSQVKLWYDKVGHQLIVNVLQAIELPTRQDGRPRNPYVKMYFLPDRRLAHCVRFLLLHRSHKSTTPSVRNFTGSFSINLTPSNLVDCVASSRLQTTEYPFPLLALPRV